MLGAISFTRSIVLQNAIEFERQMLSIRRYLSRLSDRGIVRDGRRSENHIEMFRVEQFLELFLIRLKAQKLDLAMAHLCGSKAAAALRTSASWPSRLAVMSIFFSTGLTARSERK